MGSTKNQIIATAIVNLLTLSHGLNLGWSSPATMYLGSDDSHLKNGPANAEELSWIGATITLGALTGTFIFGYLGNRIGKKRTLMILTIPNLIFWIMSYVSMEVYQLIIGRFIGGLTGGGVMRISGICIAEIAENHIRGSLGSVFPLVMYTGMLFMFIMGSFISYFLASIVAGCVPILALVLLFFLPETPYFLITKKKFDQALQSLKFYRSCNSKSSPEEIKKVEDEFEAMKNAILMATSEKVQWKDFATKEAKRGIIIGVFFVFLFNFSGNAVIMQYTAIIFKSSGSSLPPNQAAIIIALMQVIGITITSLLVDRIGRRILMIISIAGCTFFMNVMTVYLLVTQSRTDLKVDWVPVFLLAVIIFSNSLGISSLVFVMVAEIVPYKIREHFAFVAIAGMTGFMFITLKTFPPAVEAFGLPTCFCFYDVICIIGFFLIVFFMPETKGKDLLAASSDEN